MGKKATRLQSGCLFALRILCAPGLDIVDRDIAVEGGSNPPHAAFFSLPVVPVGTVEIYGLSGDWLHLMWTTLRRDLVSAG